MKCTAILTTLATAALFQNVSAARRPATTEETYKLDQFNSKEELKKLDTKKIDLKSVEEAKEADENGLNWCYAFFSNIPKELKDAVNTKCAKVFGRNMSFLTKEEVLDLIELKYFNKNVIGKIKMDGYDKPGHICQSYDEIMAKLGPVAKKQFEKVCNEGKGKLTALATDPITVDSGKPENNVGNKTSTEETKPIIEEKKVIEQKSEERKQDESENSNLKVGEESKKPTSGSEKETKPTSGSENETKSTSGSEKETNPTSENEKGTKSTSKSGQQTNQTSKNDKTIEDLMEGELNEEKLSKIKKTISEAKSFDPKTDSKDSHWCLTFKSKEKSEKLKKADPELAAKVEKMCEGVINNAGNALQVGAASVVIAAIASLFF